MSTNVQISISRQSNKEIRYIILEIKITLHWKLFFINSLFSVYYSPDCNKLDPSLKNPGFCGIF